ncbi:DUF4097 and DUF4098 domain-containing protein YvlB [Micromonospora viridifaciens]|uniref:DUF4097 and DUF4098 domain-containing protein YvlB n=1 Tax=Micromonospora viridifaciens TaxID=1881 RepID=A0A1C4W058_MICVI|nr:DUF4097 family beta strand repeat-containing protein [Micromonospora viridifaciens]SCE89600.1 DUF4097 and DUF4098 domain-containing protein YvlB [Micromonospora viridifaciens]
MPTFDTPEQIEAVVDIAVGDVRIAASDRDTTVVEVRPTDGTREADVQAAQQTRVEYGDGRLVVKAPRQKVLGMFGKVGSIDVTIDLPTGSRVQGNASVGAFRCTGRLGECRLRTSAGDIHADHTGPLDLSTSAGAVEVTSVAGRAEVSTGSGRVRLGEIDGGAVVKNSNGDSWVGTVGGDLRVNAANGNISVDRAGAGVTAATANGDIRIGEVRHGPVSVKTAMGELEVGIHGGTAAFLDLHTTFGTVRNQIEPSDTPPQDERTVEVRARTSYGDIVIRRS